MFYLPPQLMRTSMYTGFTCEANVCLPSPNWLLCLPIIFNFDLVGNYTWPSPCLISTMCDQQRLFEGTTRDNRHGAMRFLGYTRVIKAVLDRKTEGILVHTNGAIVFLVITRRPYSFKKKEKKNSTCLFERLLTCNNHWHKEPYQACCFDNKICECVTMFT